MQSTVLPNLRGRICHVRLRGVFFRDKVPEMAEMMYGKQRNVCVTKDLGFSSSNSSSQSLTGVLLACSEICEKQSA